MRVPAAAQRNNVSPVAPRREQVEAVVKEAYEKFKNDTNGKNADYISCLAKVNSKLFGIAIAWKWNIHVVMKNNGKADLSREVEHLAQRLFRNSRKYLAPRVVFCCDSMTFVVNPRELTRYRAFI